MCDYDVIPLNIAVDFPLPTQITSYEMHVPDLMVGTADQWVATLMAMLAESEEMLATGTKPKEAGNAPLSDMIALLAVHNRDKKTGVYRYQSKMSISQNLKPFLLENTTTTEYAKSFCSRHQRYLALHMSHHAFDQIGLRVGALDRAPYMRKARKRYYNLCIKPRDDTSTTTQITTTATS